MAAEPRDDNIQEPYLYNPGEGIGRIQPTNINRRQCKRVVPLRVVGVGLSRTGTTSLRQALIELGFSDCYHFSSVIQENPSDREIWMEALQGKFEGGRPFAKSDWDQLLGHCQAVTDAPSVLFWKELIDMYPESKVILTVRDSPEQWHRSHMNTLSPFHAEFGTEASHENDTGPVASDSLENMLVKHDATFAALEHDFKTGEVTALQHYNDHIAQVRNIVSPERLLVFNIKDGWSKLCNFLQVPVPAQPFPHRNTSEDFQRMASHLRDLQAAGAASN